MYELVKIRRLCRADATFLRHAQNAVLNLLPCFSGIHDNFKKSSFTCCAHIPGYTTKFLSYGKHLDLDFTDMDAIQSVIYKHFWEDGLQESASWQPLTDVRTSTSVSSRTRQGTPRGIRTSQRSATLQAAHPLMAPENPW